MADLDDFFAKKDKKKKGKKGPKFAKANTDILAQNLVENDKKTEEDEKKASTMLATSEANRAGALKDNPATDEEWHDYEEEKKDYSNLKVDTLKLDSGSEKEDDLGIDKETGEKIRSKKVENIWLERSKSANADSRDNSDDDSSPKNQFNANSEKPVEKPKKYVPPNRRMLGTDGNENTVLQKGSRGKVAAPDISEANFPCLSETGVRKKCPRSVMITSEEKEFETARGGGNQQQRTSEAPNLSLNNKFSALRN